MAKYLIYVTETISHTYEVEASSEDEALQAYDRLNREQLVSEDLDGSVGWDAPWNIEVEEEK